MLEKFFLKFELIVWTKAKKEKEHTQDFSFV